MTGPGTVLTGLREALAADGGTPPETSSRPEPVPADLGKSERTGSFGPERVLLDEKLPSDVAMLCVKENAYGPRSFELHFHYQGRIDSANGLQDLDKQQAHEELALSGLKGDLPAEEWEERFHWIRSWCGDQNAVNRWLGGLLNNERAQLIVFDVTSYELPWEMFYYRPQPGRDPEPQGWLGALVPVSRWTSLPHAWQEWHLSASPQKATGGLLMMEDEQLRADIDIYGKYEVASREPTILALVGLLAAGGEERLAFSLLMIRCHGDRTKRNRLRLDGVILETLFEAGLPALQRNRAVVLLNACITGRPTTDNEEHRGAPTRSAAQKFLAEGASGVIATLGYIDLDHSNEFAVSLVVQAGRADQNLASYLRDYRARIARRMRPTPGKPDERTPDMYKEFFWSFMYVYYGHPQTTLHLRPVDSA